MAYNANIKTPLKTKAAAMQTMTISQTKKHPEAAQRAAQTAPVVITQQGKPAFVLMSFADYQRLAEQQAKAV